MIQQYVTKDGTTGENFAEINHKHLDHVIGRVLTVLDITGGDEKARTALKSFVKREMREWLDDEFACQAAYPAPISFDERAQIEYDSLQQRCTPTPIAPTADD